MATRTGEVIDLAVVPNNCMHTMLASVRLQVSSSLHNKPVSPSSVVSLTNPSYFEEPNIKVAAFFCAIKENDYRFREIVRHFYSTWATVHVAFFNSKIFSSAH